ncbi:MAG: hypothetical protein RIQ88_457 [Actinomycetota bacterium]
MQLVDNFQQAIDFDSVYIKVSTVTGTKNSITAVIEIKDNKDGIVLDSSNVRFSLDLDGPNPIKQAYEHLKTLPEFANATDC